MDIIDYVIQTGLTSCMPVLDKTCCYCQDCIKHQPLRDVCMPSQFDALY